MSTIPINPPPTQRPFHVVVWGGSGFTGRLVAEHISRDYSKQVSWALAGRSQEKLEAIRAELAKNYGDHIKDTPILIGSLDDQASLENIASQTSVIISTAGPFIKHGTPIVEAAISKGADYVDITGEVPWIKQLIKQFHNNATQKGVKIVNCCGYDSIPSDMGALLVVDYMKKHFDVRENTSISVINAVVEGKGGISGGTIATGMHLLSEATNSKNTAEDTTSVYALIPDGAKRGTDNDLWTAEWCAPLDRWLAPFIMQICNSRIVERSNYLLHWGGPDNFHYREGVAAPNWWAAKAVALGTIAVGAAFSQKWLHPVLNKFLPAPGQGPTREQMLTGKYTHKVVGVSGQGDDKQTVIARFSDPHRDPGYWGTARLVLEAALCLALNKDVLDNDEKVLKGGVITPSAAMGMHLVERLRGAGLTIQIERVDGEKVVDGGVKGGSVREVVGALQEQ